MYCPACRPTLAADIDTHHARRPRPCYYHQHRPQWHISPISHPGTQPDDPAGLQVSPDETGYTLLEQTKTSAWQKISFTRDEMAFDTRRKRNDDECTVHQGRRRARDSGLESPLASGRRSFDDLRWQAPASDAGYPDEEEDRNHTARDECDGFSWFWCQSRGMNICISMFVPVSSMAGVVCCALLTARGSNIVLGFSWEALELMVVHQHQGPTHEVVGVGDTALHDLRRARNLLYPLQRAVALHL